MKIVALALLILLAPPALAAKGKLLELKDSGYGQARFGEKLEALEKKLNEKATELDKDFEPGCHYVTFKKYPAVSFMVEEGVVTRAETDDMSLVKNPYGVKTGAKLEDLKKLFPKMKVKDHTYDDDGHYLIFESEDTKRAIYFEDSKGKVTEGIRAGLLPSVGYVEGCL